MDFVDIFQNSSYHIVYTKTGQSLTIKLMTALLIGKADWESKPSVKKRHGVTFLARSEDETFAKT